MRVIIEVHDYEIEWLEECALECQNVESSFDWLSHVRACDFLYRIYRAIMLQREDPASADFAKLREGVS